MLTIIRLGYFIPVPGVDMAQLPAAAGGMEGEGLGSWAGWEGLGSLPGLAAEEAGVHI